MVLLLCKRNQPGLCQAGAAYSYMNYSRSTLLWCGLERSLMSHTLYQSSHTKIAGLRMASSGADMTAYRTLCYRFHLPYCQRSPSNWCLLAKVFFACSQCPSTEVLHTEPKFDFEDLRDALSVTKLKMGTLILLNRLSRCIESKGTFLDIGQADRPQRRDCAFG